MRVLGYSRQLSAWLARLRKWKASVLGAGPLPPVLAIECFGEVQLMQRGTKAAILRELSRRGKVRFVQIGANDGVMSDPIFPLISSRGDWQGVLVEPVPHLFERLKANYKGISGLIFEQVLIGSETGKKQFFYVDPVASETLADLPRWFEGLGNFDRSHIVSMLGKRVEPFIREEIFPVETISTIFSKHGVKELNLFLVDTEGFDWEIVRTLPLAKVCPEVLLAEYMHLNYFDCLRMIRFLLPYYKIRYDSNDLLCIRRGSPLVGQWEEG